MMQRGFIDEQRAIAWARQRMGLKSEFGFCRAFVVKESEDFLAVLIMSNFTRRNVDIHLATQPVFWKNPRGVQKTFREFFEEAFTRLGVARVTGLIRSSNAEARKLAEKIGFQLEGTMRKVFETDDLCVYGFLQEDYVAHRWSKQ